MVDSSPWKLSMVATRTAAFRLVLLGTGLQPVRRQQSYRFIAGVAQLNWSDRRVSCVSMREPTGPKYTPELPLPVGAASEVPSFSS